MSKYDFPECMHAMAAAMHMESIDPHGVTISLPRDEWWKLYCSLERRFRGLMAYDGRRFPMAADEFRYMGFLFKVAQIPPPGA